MPTATIRDVELVSVGTWAASTGVTTVTRADLDAMLAAHTDGLVDHAPVKLGHSSDLNAGIGDGNPAYGWVVPTSIRKNKAGRDTLVGDLVGMPSQLAAVVPTAYRRRSVEIEWDVKAGGKTYAATLIGVALLGATPPAVKGLADVVALYSEAVTGDRRDALEVIEGLEDQPAAVRVLSHLRAAGATEAELTELAVAGGMRDTVDLPPPIEVPDQHEPQTSHTSTTAQEARTMTVTDEQLRQALGLEAEADVQTEVDRIIAERQAAQVPGTQPAATAPAAVTPPAPASPAAPAAPTTPEVGAQTATGQPQTPELVGAGAGTVQLSAANLSELQREAAWARGERRRQVLDNAVRAGRISPAERGVLTSELSAGQTPAEHVTGFAAQLERDEEGTTRLLDTLSPRFAVTAFGADDAVTAPTADAAFDEFESTVFGLNRS